MLVGDNLNSNINHETGEVLETHNDTTFKLREKELQEEEVARQEAKQLERNSPYSNWTQLNLQYSKEWRALSKKSPIGMQIMLFFMEHMDGYNAIVCSSKVIEEALGYSRPTIARALKVLRESNFLKIAKSGTTNIYYVNSELTWKSWGTNLKYAEFTAKVIISETEQTEDTKQPIKQTSIKTKKINTAIIKEDKNYLKNNNQNS